MVRRVILAILSCLLGLGSYFAVWSVQYRLPAGPPEIVDLRRSASDVPYCVTFCASLADNPVGFPGHAYVVWSPSAKIDLERDHSLGFMPRKFEDQIPSLFAVVPGTVLDHAAGNFRNLDRLTVVVSRSDYLRSLAAASNWSADNFKAGKRDCTAFVQYVAASLGLETSNSAYAFPQDYLSRLKRLNSSCKSSCRAAEHGKSTTLYL
jgi:hypothetical protein